MDRSGGGPGHAGRSGSRNHENTRRIFAGQRPRHSGTAGTEGPFRRDRYSLRGKGRTGQMIRIAIIGATSYTGGELLRYLLRHPDASIGTLTSETYAGRPVSDIHKFLKGKSQHVLVKLDAAAIASSSDVAFLCLPHST